MAILEIRYLGDPILRRATRTMESYDDDLARLVEDLLDTMYAAEGVGLAAPQVGDERRVAVIDVGELRDGTEAIVLVNPRVVERRGEVRSEEGCLSIPGVIETIGRAAEVAVEYLDRAGDTRTIEGADLLARALQHEIDHLDGILFIDHLGPLRRRLVVREFRKALEEKGIPAGSA
ncbi:MAG: peptide deformylase [Gemmatimonadota bacterium]